LTLIIFFSLCASYENEEITFCSTQWRGLGYGNWGLEWTGTLWGCFRKLWKFYGLESLLNGLEDKVRELVLLEPDMHNSNAVNTAGRVDILLENCVPILGTFAKNQRPFLGST